MKSEWKETKLIDVCEFQKGFAFKSKDYRSGGVKIIRVSDLNDTNICLDSCVCLDQKEANKYLQYELEEDDIIITTVGSWPTNPRSVVGKVIKVQSQASKSLLNQNAVRVRAKQSQHFIYYLLRCKDFLHYIVGTAQGSANQASITQDDIKNYTFKLPSVSEQRAIAATLSCLDDKIELNNKINANLEAQAQAIFKSWFVNFEPFGGVMPDDWRKGTLGDIASVTSGKRPHFRQTTTSAEADIPLIGASSIMGFTNTILYDEKILITGRVGTHGIIQRYSRPCWASDNTLIIKSNYYEFVYQLLCDIDFHNMNRGSTQPLITQTDLKNAPIILPSETILYEFEDLVGSLMKRYEDSILESERLAKIRDTLLPRLMSGEIEIPLDK